MGLAEAADANLASSAGYLIERGLLPGGSVQRLGNVVVVDSGLPDDTYNLIVGASNMTAGDVDRTIEAARSTGRPFAWWVAPVAEQEGLEGLLVQAGLPVNEREPLMCADTTQAASSHPELEIRQVDSPAALADFAEIDAHLWNPPNENVRRFFELTQSSILDAHYPGRFFVGYCEGRAVACTELHFAAGVAGLYNVATREPHRRRGFARAMVDHALAAAREMGFGQAILQSSPEGQPLYRSLDFEPLGEYVEFSVV